MKLNIQIENAYADGELHITQFDLDVPPPGADMQEWAEEHLFPFTGTGKEDSDATYGIEIRTCEDQTLVGKKFEF